VTQHDAPEEHGTAPPENNAGINAGINAGWFISTLTRLTGRWLDTHGQEIQGKVDLGALATLRRGLGRPGGAVAELCPYVTPYLPPEATAREEDAYFLIAGLFASHQLDWPPSAAHADTTFGASYRLLAEAVGRDSVERRFVALLNAHPDDVAYHLRHAVALLATNMIPIDWTRLLRDVIVWSQPDRGVQRAWARSFWRA
jgi:CRISPR system Cascade subunit CasB